MKPSFTPHDGRDDGALTDASFSGGSCTHYQPHQTAAGGIMTHGILWCFGVIFQFDLDRTRWSQSTTVKVYLSTVWPNTTVPSTTGYVQCDHMEGHLRMHLQTAGRPSESNWLGFPAQIPCEKFTHETFHATERQCMTGM